MITPLEFEKFMMNSYRTLSWTGPMRMKENYMTTIKLGDQTEQNEQHLSNLYLTNAMAHVGTLIWPKSPVRIQLTVDPGLNRGGVVITLTQAETEELEKALRKARREASEEEQQRMSAEDSDEYSF